MPQAAAPKAYVVAIARMKNDAWLKEYGPKTAAIVRRHGGRYLTGGANQPLELANAPADAVVLIEFPTVKKARDWHSDPEYQPLIKLRQSGADVDLYVVEATK